jgi:uncharacterized Zn finger protein
MIPNAHRRSPAFRRPEADQGCDHRGPTVRVVDEETGRYAARCPACGTAGPVRSTPEAARKALLVMGARDRG